MYKQKDLNISRQMREAFYSNDKIKRSVERDQVSKKSTDRMSKPFSDMVSKLTADRTTISKRLSNYQSNF